VRTNELVVETERGEFWELLFTLVLQTQLVRGLGFGV